MPGPARPPAWPTLVAYVLLALPLVYTLVAEHADPAPPDTAAMLYVTIGIAVGAGLFIVRRSPRNVIGWIGLVGWGGLSLAAIVRALIA
jgi:hypothetical protein